MKPKLTTEELLALLAPAKDRKFVMSLVDHRGRQFICSFFVSRDCGAPGWFVWGQSKSGATKIVARPKMAWCRNASGARVHPGWRREGAAEEVAKLLNLYQGRELPQSDEDATWYPLEPCSPAPEFEGGYDEFCSADPTLYPVDVVLSEHWKKRRKKRGTR